MFPRIKDSFYTSHLFLLLLHTMMLIGWSRRVPLVQELRLDGVVIDYQLAIAKARYDASESIAGWKYIDLEVLFQSEVQVS
jgi:hypothetical protein